MNRRDFLKITAVFATPLSESESRPIAVVPPPGPLNWIPAAGECRAVTKDVDGNPANVMMDVRPYFPGNGSGVSYRGVVGAAAMIGAWGSAAFAETYSPLGAAVYQSAGDGDYWGQEVYTWDVSTRRHARITNPQDVVNQTDPDFVAWLARNEFPAGYGKVWVYARSLPDNDPRYWNPFECEHGPHVPGHRKPVPNTYPTQFTVPTNPVGAGPLPDGTIPGCPHIYDGLGWLPPEFCPPGNVKGMLLRPHSTFCFTTASTARAHALNLDDKRWWRYSNNALPLNGGRLTLCALDRAAKRVYHAFGYLDLANKQQVFREWGWVRTNHPSSKTVFDEKHRLWLAPDSQYNNGPNTTTPGALLAIAPDVGAGFFRLNLQGDIWPIGYSAFGGFTFCPDLGCYFLYNAVNSNTAQKAAVGPEVLYKIVPPETDPLTNPWVVTKELMGGTPPPRQGKAIGSIGRFFWIQSIKCLGFINGATMPVYVYKPRGL